MNVIEVINEEKSQVKICTGSTTLALNEIRNARILNI